MNQFQYYTVKTKQFLVNVLIVLFPPIVIALALLLVNVSELKTELRNTMGLNDLVEETIVGQAVELKELNKEFADNQEEIRTSASGEEKS